MSGDAYLTGEICAVIRSTYLTLGCEKIPLV